MDDMATSLSDLPGGAPLSADSIPFSHDRRMEGMGGGMGSMGGMGNMGGGTAMSELEARRQADVSKFQSMTSPPPPGQILDDPRGDPYSGSLHNTSSNLHSFANSTSKGITNFLTFDLLFNFKEPLLVALLCFLVHQEFFSNIVLGFLPYSLKFLASPGSSSMIPSLVKALIVGVFFFFFRTLL